MRARRSRRTRRRRSTRKPGSALPPYAAAVLPLPVSPSTAEHCRALLPYASLSMVPNGQETSPRPRARLAATWRSAPAWLDFARAAALRSTAPARGSRGSHRRLADSIGQDQPELRLRVSPHIWLGAAARRGAARRTAHTRTLCDHFDSHLSVTWSRSASRRRGVARVARPPGMRSDRPVHGLGSTGLGVAALRVRHGMSWQPAARSQRPGPQPPLQNADLTTVPARPGTSLTPSGLCPS